MTEKDKEKLRLVVKIGSNVLTRKDGTLDVTRMSALIDQIVELKQAGVEVIVVSSGAVAAGKAEIQPHSKLDMVSSRQLFSAVGQVKLINHYHSLFQQHKVICGQILATKEDFATRRHYLNQRNCMTVMLENGAVPIVNENDAISVNELMFTDNDELSGLVAAMMDAQKLIILSNIDGIYNGDPASADAEVIRTIDVLKDNIEEYIRSSKSSAGRGGMQTKYNIARKVAEEGVEVIIANGKRENILCDIVGQQAGCIYTRFAPVEKKTSSVKKWIAHSEGFAKGEVYINEGAKDALSGDKAISLLPVGVVKITGEFEADDIVKIMAENGAQIGVGKIACDSEEARAQIGKKQTKPIIHYDYLYLEK
ncbi:MAG: glutamate 5-kinase [Prevotella sp.]|jgi:glutamate 5-kinase|nr:glutamate 5-kinase [Prevotella sp.]